MHAWYDQRRLLFAGSLGCLSIACLVFVARAKYPQFSLQARDCSICSSSPDICAKWGASTLERSHAYIGSGENFQSFVQKILHGADIHIGVLGGSISSCEEVQHIESQCWPYRLQNDLNARFSHKTGATFRVTNGAQAASSSAFALGCGHLRVPEDADLMILEFSVNDLHGQLVDKPMSYLIRSLLESGRAKSLIFLDIYSRLWYWYDASGSILTLAQFYDLPVISSRNIMRHISTLPTELYKDFYNTTRWVPGHHPSPKGHEFATDLLLAFVDLQICKHQRRGDMPLAPWILPPLPPADPWQVSPYDKADSFAISGNNLFCEEAVNLDVDPERTIGFKSDKWKTKSYFVGKQVGDRLALRFRPSDQLLCATLFYWKSQTLGFGQAACTVNGDPNSREVLTGYWDQDINGLAPSYIGWHLRTPISTLECEIIEATDDPGGQHEFRVSAVALSTLGLEQFGEIV